jgi:hypothetical protein
MSSARREALRGARAGVCWRGCNQSCAFSRRRRDFRGRDVVWVNSARWGTKRRASRTGVDGAAKARRGGARAAARVNVALLCQFQVSRGEE